MKFFIFLLCSTFVATSALATPPSQESIEKLLTVMETKKHITAIPQQIDDLIKKDIDQKIKEQNLSPDSQKFLESYRKKMIKIMSKDLSWEKMKTFYVPLYTETFNQEEIDSLIIFYESPTGKMVISKVPLVMNKTMTIMQQLMQIEMLRIEAAYNEALEEAVSLNKQTVK